MKTGRISIYLIILFSLSSCNRPVVHPHTGEIVEAVYGLGTVESEDVFRARSGVTVSIVEFYVKEGQDVKKGQKLFKTDEGTIVRAPFYGRITEIPVFPHEILIPQTIILSLINLDNLYLSVSLEQQGAMRIKKGLKAEISFEFFRNKKIPGYIDTIYPQQNEFIARVKLLKMPEGVLPGMTADVAFEIDRKKNATLIPVRALANGNIILKRGGKKIKKPARVGLVDLDYAEILEPKLSLSDEIIMP